MRLLPFLATETFGRYLVLNSFAILFIALGMILKPPTMLGLLLFVPALACSIALSFAINLLVGIIAFYTVEARSLRWVANFPIQFLSGVVIPLSFFPQLWREIIIRSPFPGLIAGPVLALQARSVTPELQTLFTWSIFWAVALPLVALAIWTRSLRSYEAVGL